MLCSMDFVLERLNESKDKTHFVLDRNGGFVFCGRGRTNNIICLSKIVSRKHCMFHCSDGKLYVTDLGSSNGIYINDILQQTQQAIKLNENDVIGIGINNVDPDDPKSYAYKICTIKPHFFNEGVESNMADAVYNNDKSPRASTSSSNRVLGEKCKFNSTNNDKSVPYKIKCTSSKEHNSRINLFEGIIFESSHNDQNSHNSNNTNNLVKLKTDIHINEESDDIEIIHTSLSKDVKKYDTKNSNLSPPKYLKNNNKSNLDDKIFQHPTTSSTNYKSDEIMDISNDEDDIFNNNKTDKNKIHTTENISNGIHKTNALNITKNLNSTCANNKIIKTKNKQQRMNGGEETTTTTTANYKTTKKSPIKLEEVKQEAKTEFSEFKIIEISDDEDGIFPYSQLFDSKFEESKVKIECDNDQCDDQNIENNDRPDVDDDVVILSDSEDENNPWLERLSRSQIENKDNNSNWNNTIIKKELDLGIWEADEIANIIKSVSHTFETSNDKDTSLELDTNVDDKNKDEDNSTIQSVVSCTSQVPNNENTSFELDTNVNDKRKDKNKSTIRSAVPCTSQVPENDNTSFELDINDKSKDEDNSNNTDLIKKKNIMDIVDTGSKDHEPNLESTSDINEKKTDKILEQDTNKLDKSDKEKVSVESTKPKLIKERRSKLIKDTKMLIPVIEPLHLPKRRRRQSDGSKDRTSKAHEKRSSTKSKTEEKEKTSKLKIKFKDGFYNKEHKHQKEILKSPTDCRSPGETKAGLSISKDEKRMIIEKRKEKLKEIAAEEKRLAAKNNQNIQRRIAKPRAKISLKNRGDFLIPAEQELFKSFPDKSTNVPKSSANCSKEQFADQADIFKTSTTSDMKKNQTKDVSKRNTVNATLLQQTTEVPKSSTNRPKNRLSDQADILKKSKQVFKDSTKSSKASDKEKKYNNSKETKRNNENMSESQDKFTESASALVQEKTTETANSLKSNFKSLKSNLKPNTKKKVTFVEKPFIKEFEIDSRNNMKKLEGKDAPIPTNKLTRRSTSSGQVWAPKLDEFLLRIFMWNPVWLDEQCKFNMEPPIVSSNEIQAMKLSYDSYKQYYEVVMPLLLHEIWHTMTKDLEAREKNMQRGIMTCSIVQNSVVRTPISSNSNLFLTTMMIEILVDRAGLDKPVYPVYGDLVALQININRKTFQIFAYVTNMYQMIITESTHYNKELRRHVQNPYAVITYTLQTRPLDWDISVNQSLQRVRTVMYLRATMRMVQALQYLPQSPLLNQILNPKIRDYYLPPMNESYASTSLVTKDNLNSKQLEAVFRVSQTVLNEEPKLCFIQGPPGTGKSTVIVNLITQILYNENPNYKKPLKILVCAPSNAAIDEIALRLLNIRSTLEKGKHFNMVRIGRPETMHPLVKTISVTDLAKRHLREAALKHRSPNYNEEIASIASYLKSLNLQSASFQRNEAKRQELEKKLHNAKIDYELIKSGKTWREFTSKELVKYQRMAENAILTGADIITCTLSSCYTNLMESKFGINREKISVCIVDEATQSCEAETLIPLMLGVNTLVLVGDPNQLPATILSQRAKRLGLDRSIFSRIQNIFASQPHNPIIMLDMQYRMDYSISYWPNRYFYGGKLKNAIDWNNKFPFHAYKVLDHNSAQNIDKFSNSTEAEFVANIIYVMLMFPKWEEDSPISLGVLTPYNNQRTLVLSKINEKIFSIPDKIKKRINFEVNTVDGFQGQERDIIIMSCVRSQGIGFLSDRQRLCVALTRAKYSLILCGNFNTFRKDQMWNALLTDALTRGNLCHVNANATPAIIKKFIIK